LQVFEVSVLIFYNTKYMSIYCRNSSCEKIDAFQCYHAH